MDGRTELTDGLLWCLGHSHESPQYESQSHQVAERQPIIKYIVDAEVCRTQAEQKEGSWCENNMDVDDLESSLALNNQGKPSGDV